MTTHPLQPVKERILAKTSLESLIERHTSLRKQGGQSVGCCPFHEEKSPSFYVFHDHYHCFGCGAHGDAISFVQNKENLGFIDALKSLAREFQVDIPELESPTAKDSLRAAAQKHRILTQAHDYVKHHLLQNQVALQYLRGRAFTEEQIKDWGLGYAPSMNSQFVSEFLRSRGFSVEDIIENSLATRTSQGKIYDFFRGRLLVPIFDHMGSLVAFGGRSLGEEQPKYKNSRFDKSSVLFGLQKAKEYIPQKNRAIIVEGYFDVFRMWSLGFPETVACQGTALTSQHLKLLGTWTRVVYLLFDGDKAGVNAAKKTISLALNTPKILFKAAKLPEGDDPDSFLTKNSGEKLEEVLSQASDLVEFCIREEMRQHADTSLPVFVRESILPWLAEVPDPIQRSYLTHKASQMTGVDIKELLSQVAMPKKKNSLLEERAIADDESELLPLQKESLSHVYFSSPKDLSSHIESFLRSDLRLTGIWLYLMEDFLSHLKNGRSPQEASLEHHPSFQHPKIRGFLLEILGRKAAFVQSDPKSTPPLLTVFRHYQRQNLKRSIHTLKERLILSPKSEESSSILATISKLHQELTTLERGV